MQGGFSMALVKGAQCIWSGGIIFCEQGMSMCFGILQKIEINTDFFLQHHTFAPNDIFRLKKPQKLIVHEKYGNLLFFLTNIIKSKHTQKMFFYYLNQCNREASFPGLQTYPLFSHYDCMGLKLFPDISRSPIENHTKMIYPGVQVKEEAKAIEEIQILKMEEETSQKTKPKMKKSKNRMEEEEYNPEEIDQKKGKKTNQNIKRNIIPNIIHQVFCFLQKRTRSQKIVQRYFQNGKQNLQNQASFTRFYNYQKLFKDKTNNYINSRGLRELNNYQQPSFEIYSKEEQDIYLKLNRILVRHFLSNELNLVIMTSLRMKGRSREYYLQAKRKIQNILQEQMELY